jgi:transmembrane 9 superfamily protein 2/4
LQDISQYNDPANMEEAKEESGWKLVHGDVFRPPASYPMLFRCAPYPFLSVSASVLL